MKYIIITLLLLISPLIVAETVFSETVWLDSKMRPVAQAEASYVLGEITAVEQGYRLQVNYPSGKVRLETLLDQADLNQATQIGDYRLYYESGQLLQRGNRDQQGRYQGMVFRYHENGQVHREIPYLDGLVHGVYNIFSQEGQLLRKQHVQQQKRHGKDLHYHANGKLRIEAHYVAGNKEGATKRWNADGILLRREHYKNDKLTGLSEEFYADGELKSSREFDNGKSVGEHQSWSADGTLQRYRLYDQEGKELIQRVYRKDGSLQRKKEQLVADFGPAMVDEEYNAAGQLTSRTTTSEDKVWYRSERYNKTGELTEWYQSRNRKRHGREFYQRASGAYTDAYYEDGKRHGKYHQVDADGKVLASGVYQHGQRVGDWYQHAGLSQFYEFYTEQGELHGERKELDADGQLVRLEHYRRGQLHGEAITYQDGKVVSQGKFANGKRHGWWQLKDGHLAGPTLKGNYATGVQTGEWRRYSKNDYLIGVLHYDSQGQQHGRELLFEENGELITVTDYKHGVRHGEQWLYLDGTPITLRKYQDGKLVEELAADEVADSNQAG